MGGWNFLLYTIVGKAGPSPVTYIVSVLISVQPEMLHTLMSTFYIVLFVRHFADENLVCLVLPFLQITNKKLGLVYACTIFQY